MRMSSPSRLQAARREKRRGRVRESKARKASVRAIPPPVRTGSGHEGRRAADFSPRYQPLSLLARLPLAFVKLMCLSRLARQEAVWRHVCVATSQGATKFLRLEFRAFQKNPAMC